MLYFYFVLGKVAGKDTIPGADTKAAEAESLPLT